MARVRGLIQTVYPSATVQVFGSYETKLYLPSSDLDIVVQDASLRIPDCLFTLAQVFETEGFAEKIEVIDKARVPIIKLVEKRARIPIDISFNMDSGPESAELIKTVLQDTYLGETIRSLMLLLKQFLTQRYMNEVYLGGLGSYALVLMIITFLKIHPLVQSKQLNLSQNLGILFLEFLDYYGHQFSYFSCAIDWGYDLSPRLVPKQKPIGGFQRGNYGYFQLMDPQDRENDVTRGSFAYNAIKIAFMKAYTRLTSLMCEYMDRVRMYERDINRAKRYNEKRKRPKHPGRLNTILGTVLGFEKRVIEQRELIEEVCNSLAGSEWNMELIPSGVFVDLSQEMVQPPKKRQKKKKSPKSVSSDHSVELIEYVEAESSAHEDVIQLNIESAPTSQIVQELSSSDIEEDAIREASFYTFLGRRASVHSDGGDMTSYYQL